MGAHAPAPAHSMLALASAACLVLLTAAPGVAAQPIAQADATSLVLTVLNASNDRGTVEATHDGDSETVTGTRDRRPSRRLPRCPRHPPPG